MQTRGAYLKTYATNLKAVLTGMTDLSAHNHVAELSGYLATIITQATAP